MFYILLFLLGALAIYVVRQGLPKVPVGTWLAGATAGEGKDWLKPIVPGLIGILVLIVTYFVLWAQYPGFMQRYEANGGPVLRLLLLVILFALAVNWTTGGAQRALTTALFILMVIITLPPAMQAVDINKLDLGVGFGGGNGGGGKAVVTNYTTPDPNCPGQLHQGVLIDSKWREINPGGRCRIMYDFPPDSVKLGNGNEGQVVNAGFHELVASCIRSLVGPIRVNYSLCPLSTGSRDIGWDCQPI